MNFRPQTSPMPGAVGHAKIVFWRDPPTRFRGFAKCLQYRLPMGFLILAPLVSQAQTIDAVSREVSLFNFGQPVAISEAVSREVSVFDAGQPTATSEALSREVSLFNFGQPTVRSEAVSREVSLFDFGQSVARIEAVSREVSIFDRGYNSFDTVSREVSVFFFGPPTAGLEGISREVSVYDYGYNHLNFTVGSTVVLAGTSGSVPVNFSTLAPVTNVQIAVDFPQNLLTNWSVQPQSPLTGTAFVSNRSRLYLSFTPANGQSIVNTQQLGRIAFLSASNQPSAFLPLPVASATAALAENGATYTPYQTTQNGQVVVLNGRSLLQQSLGTNGQENLTLYGLSTTNYTIESATNLTPPVLWQPAYTLTPSNFIAVTPGVPATNPAMFFRAQQ